MTRWTGLDTPSLLYSAVHQVGAGFDEHERKTGDFHHGLRHGMARWNAESAERIRAAIQTLGATITLTSDDEAAVATWLGDLVGPEVELGSWEVRSVAGPDPSRRAAPLLERGRARLEEWGFDPDRPVAESHFVVDGSDRLDILESLVRDRLGIYRPPHGPMMAGLTATAFGLANRLVVHGTDTAWDGRWEEAHLNFSKGKMRYEEFRSRLAVAVAAIADLSPWVAAYQRKLGLGPMREFSVRFAATPETRDRLLTAFSDADDYVAGVAERSALFLGERMAL